MWTVKPARAWRKHILADASDARWINDGQPISKDVPLQKRELFGLILYAQLHGPFTRVGFDPDQPEPNDGLIIDGQKRVRCEHKVIVEKAKNEVLEEIVETYRKQAVKGEDYGKDRTLIIQPNKPTKHGGLIKISDLMHEIGDSCHFDRVITIGQVSRKGEKSIIHLIQHYPSVKEGVAEVCFDCTTGSGYVSHNPLKL